MYNIRVNVIVNLKTKYVATFRCPIPAEVVYNTVPGSGCRELVDIAPVFLAMLSPVWPDQSHARPIHGLLLEQTWTASLASLSFLSCDSPNLSVDQNKVVLTQETNSFFHKNLPLVVVSHNIFWINHIFLWGGPKNGQTSIVSRLFSNTLCLSPTRGSMCWSTTCWARGGAHTPSSIRDFCWSRFTILSLILFSRWKTQTYWYFEIIKYVHHKWFFFLSC